MDSYLGIAGLALALAALVPILFPATRVKLWTVTVAALSLVILIGIYQVYKEVVEHRAIVSAKEQIWQLLTQHQKGMSFDQIYDSMYYPDFVAANAAIDELVAEKQIDSEKIDVTGSDGAKFVVRRFFRHFD